MEHLYVQYGCGLTAPESWVNFDVSPTLRLQKVPLIGSLLIRSGPRFPPGARYGDITKGLPIADESCVGIYCSHVLEHLALDDLRKALRHTFQCLRPNGIFRLVLPDIEQLAKRYMAANDAAAALRFMEESRLGHKSRPRGPSGLARAWLGNSQHLWMWDFKALAAELGQAGFVDIRRAAFGDAQDRRFDEVEDEGRWRDAVGIECRRAGPEGQPCAPTATS